MLSKLSLLALAAMLLARLTITSAVSADGKLMSITSTSDAPSDTRLVFEKI